MAISSSFLIGSTERISGAATPPVPATAAELAGTAPRMDTPVVLDGEIFAIVRAGDRIILGGNFTQSRNAADVGLFNQAYLMAYDVNTGQIDTSWKPDLNGEVIALAIDPDEDTLFVGGSFTFIDGEEREHLGAVTADFGTLVESFDLGTNRKVTALTVHDDRLYVGGTFSSIGGINRKRLASIDFANEAVDLTFDLPIEDPSGLDGGSSVRRLEVTPDGETLMTVHNDRLVDGQLRTGVALIDLTGAAASLRPWYTDLYELNRCREGTTRVRDGALSPDGAYLVVVSSGDDLPPACDSAVAFPVAGDGLVEPLWVSRHFDTIESIEITYNAIYVGGHFLYQEAPGSPDPWPGDTNKKYGAGKAAELGDDVVPREKLGALHPYDGKALPWPAAANGPRGVFAIEDIGGELFIGHDGDEIGHETIGRHGSFLLPVTPPGAKVVHPAGLVVIPDGVGYWMAESDGQLYEFGSAADLDDVANSTVDIATSEDGTGLWILGHDGVVTTRGAATWFGNVPAGVLGAGESPTAIAVRPSGDGYWIFTDLGRAMAFGAAEDLGDVTHLTLDGPVIASVATPSGLGYWLIGSDGGVFTFGDAVFSGSTGGLLLDKAVVGMAADPDGLGYWLVARDGGVFAFDAEFRGSVPGVLAGVPLQGDIVAIVSFGNGYVMLGDDGGAFSFSDIAFLGSLGANPPNTPVVAIAAFG